MSWLSDHIFGAPKSKDEPKNEVTSPTSDTPAEGEIQNDTVTTSDATAAAAVANAEESGAALAYENREVAAEWHIPVQGKLYKVEFEHGTTSGRRILWVDEKVCSGFPTDFVDTLTILIYSFQLKTDENCSKKKN